MKIEDICISEKLAKRIITNIGRRFNVYLDVLKYQDGIDHSLVGFNIESKNDDIPRFTSLVEIPDRYDFEYYFIEAEGTPQNKYITVSTEESRKYKTMLKEMMKLCSENLDIVYPHFYGYGKSIVLIPRNTTIYELLIKYDLFFLEK